MPATENEMAGENHANARLFAYLAKHHPGIIGIEVEYDGWGDEGWIDAITFVDASKPRKRGLPRGAGYRRDAIQSASAKATADDELWALVTNVWGAVFPGGDGAGGYGTVFIYPATQHVDVAHESRSEEEFNAMVDEIEDEETEEEEVDEEEDE